MATSMEIPSRNVLRNLSYSELKKVAKTHGIKVNMKAEKIISSLLSVNSDSSDSMECFLTPSQKMINSSRKNKENKFNADEMIPLDTPRRGTYSVESPSESFLVDKIEDASSLSSTIDNTLNVSNITVCRGSERKLRSRKVAFVTPIKTTPSRKYLSLKDRPKTPISSRMSGGRVTFSTPVTEQTSQEPSLLIQGKSPSSHSKVTKSRRSSGNTKTTASDDQPASKLKRKTTPSNTKASSDDQPASKLKRRTTPSNTKPTDDQSASKLKRKATPNFQRIHQKAFDKMESIDDYQKRKIVNSAKKIGQLSQTKTKATKLKSKIPVAFSGIPFIPASGINSTKVPSCSRSEKRNVYPQAVTRSFSSLKAAGKQKVETSNENVPLKSKKKFDLQASLSRKLGYTPYTGALKPLTESNSINKPCIHSEKHPINKVVKKNRSQTRSVLQGVRVNKRFELQMKNRKLD